MSRRALLRRGGLLAASTGAFGPLLAACSGSKGGGSTGATGAQEIEFGLANAFAGFNPALAPQVASLTIIRHVFEPLVRYDEFENALSPWMLQDFPQKNGSVYEAALLPGLKFHDGSPVSPSDVAFTFEYMKDPKNGAFLGAFLAPIDKVETQGDKIQFTLTQDFAAFNALLSVITVIPEKIFSAQGNDAFSAKPVGSGPYSFGPTTPGSKVELDRYKGYKGRFKPTLDKIVFNYIVDDSTREVEILSNQLDVIDTVPYRDFDTLGKNASIETGSTLGDRHLVMETNHTATPFSDVRVRQALMYAMDRQAIIDSVFLGKYGAICDSLLPPDNPFFVQPSTTYRPDPERAKSLLREAGYPNGVDFQLLLSTIPYITQCGQLMKEQWEKAGLRATIRLTETEAGYGIVATKKYDVYVAYGVEYAFGTDPDIIYRIFLYGPNRVGFYGSNTPEEQQYDKFVDQGLLAATDDERKQAYGSAQNIVSETVTNNFPLIFAANLGAWRKGITGYRPGPGDIPNLMSTKVG
jgi:peptide/nickel transport system substrate-binding protein